MVFSKTLEDSGSGRGREVLCGWGLLCVLVQSHGEQGREHASTRPDLVKTFKSSSDGNNSLYT